MPLVIALHVLAVVGWVGGMAFALFVMRPALSSLPPPQRVPVLASAFARFVPAVGVAVLVIVATGGMLIGRYGGLRNAGWGIHTMLGLGIVMVAVYVYLWLRLNPRLQAAARAGDWPAAGAAAESIRRAVAFNLVLGVIVIAAAIADRA